MIPKDHGQLRCYSQHVGEVQLIYHRAMPKGAVSKHVVVKWVTRKWDACRLRNMPEPAHRPVPTGTASGVDLGLKSLLATSPGSLINNPPWRRQALAQLRVAQRRVSRRRKGSKGWNKAVTQVARLHEQLANQSSAYWHKRTRSMAKAHSLIALEDLKLKFINRNKLRSLSSHEAGLGLFTQRLAYKVAETGCQLVVVNPADTSQAGSACSALVEKSLSVGIQRCHHCGLELDRDVNAARNVLQKACNPLRLSVQDLTWAIAPSVS